MISFIFTLVLLSLANSAISVTVAESRFFQGFRDWIFHSGYSSWITFIHELVSCSYCISHWVAIALVIIWQPPLLITNTLFDYPIVMFTIVGLTKIVTKQFG